MKPKINNKNIKCNQDDENTGHLYTNCINKITNYKKSETNVKSSVIFNIDIFTLWYAIEEINVVFHSEFFFN